MLHFAKTAPSDLEGRQMDTREREMPVEILMPQRNDIQAKDSSILRHKIAFPAKPWIVAAASGILGPGGREIHVPDLDEVADHCGNIDPVVGFGATCVRGRNPRRGHDY